MIKLQQLLKMASYKMLWMIAIGIFVSSHSAQAFNDRNSNTNPEKLLLEGDSKTYKNDTRKSERVPSQAAINRKNNSSESLPSLLEEHGENTQLCLSNASFDNKGQFIKTYEIISDPGETWYPILPVGVYMPMPPFQIGVVQDLVLVEETDEFDEVPDGALSHYYLHFLVEDGVEYSVQFTNETDTIDAMVNVANYTPTEIEGPANICGGSMEEYCVEELDGAVYEWSLASGGEIVGPIDESCVMVLWEDVFGGPHELQVLVTEACANPARIEVNIATEGGAISCIGDVNISLSESCSAEITADMMLVSEMVDDAIYEVILTDPSGNMLSSNILDESHIGIPIMVKVMDVCSGNSCWSTITVEDKLPPTIEAMDLVIGCHEFAGLGDPVGVDSCGGPVEVTKLSEVITSLNCVDTATHEIIRTYIATDQYGNESEELVQTIILSRIVMDDIIFPADRTLENDDPLYCNSFELDGEGNPSSADTGVPTYDGTDLFPFADIYCGFGMSYTDQVFPQLGCVTKIMRTWTAYEWWCDSAIISTHTQVLNIADVEAPEFDMPADFEVTTDVGECVATVNLPSVSPTDDCSTTFDVDIQVPGGFINNSNGGTAELALGENEIIYTVYDECLNSSSQSFTITVRDNTPPVMACDGNTVISLNADGISYAPAEVFDDGVIDDCSIDYLEVRRMDSGAACGIDNFTFGPKVEFCCADVGEPVVVILRAYDMDGNSNECMVDVVVQDKNAPVITCPDNVTIECDYDYDLDDLTEFGSAEATDNCFNTNIIESSSHQIDDCGVGFIVRTFTASDGNGSAACSQIIYIENNNPFESTDITWPEDYEADLGCGADGLDPASLDPPYNYPVINTEACDNVGFGFSDKVYNIDPTGGSCLKIIRKWIVTDECAVGGPVDYVYDQTLIVTNSMAPEIMTSCEPIDMCIFENCDEGQISLTSSAMDDCTPDDMLQWSYNIDLDRDGDFDLTDNGLGGDINFDGILPIGDHLIVYSFSDLCGNTTTCTQEFTLNNCDLPIAYCTDINVELGPMDTDGDGEFDDEMVVVPASIIGAGSVHPCGTPVIIAFDSLGINTTITYNCLDIGIQTVTVYVIGEDGQFSSCTAEIEVQDNNEYDLCPDFKDCIIEPTPEVTIDFCVPSLDPDVIGNGLGMTDDCFCEDFDVDYSDEDLADPNNSCNTILRTWSVTFNCGNTPLVCTYEQTITQLNGTAPIITACGTGGAGSADDEDCEGFVSVSLPTYELGCSFGVEITNDSEFADSNIGDASGVYPVGETTFNYIVTDECGNASNCQVVITVEDDAAPICAVQDISVVIGDSGEITIADDAVDNGSFDICGSGPLTYSTAPTTFDCSDLGENTVEMTITDTEGNSSVCTATVIVTDDVAPLCNAAAIVNATLFSAGTYVITPQIAEELFNDGSTDPCGEIVSYEVVPNTFDCSDIGMNDVTLIVTDNNGNVSECSSILNLDDEVAPVCNVMDITINIETNGSTTVQGIDLDDGSTDACGMIVSYEVEPNVFTCDDEGPNNVVVTITDNSGNTCEADAVVTVINAEEISCAAQDLTVYLDANGSVTILPEDVDNGSMAPCGSSISLSLDEDTFDCADSQSNTTTVTLTVTDDNSGDMVECTAEITVLDTISPNVVCPDNLTFECTVDISDPAVFGEVSFTDNCIGTTMNDTIITDNRNDCGIGTIERMYVAMDASGNTDSCTQIITIINSNPFSEDNIDWPVEELDVTDCTSLLPEDLESFPVLDTDNVACFNISVDYEDMSTGMGTTECLDTITRTWTVIETCQLDGTGTGIFTFVQTIYLDGTAAPVIEGPMDITLYSTEESCSQFADLSGVTVMDCSTELTVSNDSEFADDNNSLDASGDYGLGNTLVTLTATDDCDNTTNYSYNVTVLDTIDPIVDCVKVFPEIEENEMVTVNALDYIASVSDNCTAEGDLDIQFILDFDENDDDPTDNETSPTMTFGCDDVDDLNVLFLIIYDESGNWTFCGALTTVVDPNDFCGNGFAGEINGETTLNSGIGVNQVAIEIEGQTDTYQGSTNLEGEYNFDGIENYETYLITPHKNDQLLSGVTTLDMILIQKHILGLQPFNNPYDMIAADINHSGNISGSDIIALRKVMLGIEDEFVNNTSFRFVDADHNFIDESDPFHPEFPEAIAIPMLVGSATEDFVAIKIGDVNGSYTDGNLIEEGDEDNTKIKMNSNSHKLYTEAGLEITRGQEYNIPIMSNRFSQLQGLELNLQTKDLEILSIESDGITIDPMSYKIAQNGQSVKIVWMDEVPTNVSEGTILFSIRVRANQNTTLDTSIEMIGSTNEFYTADLDAVEVAFRGSEVIVESSVKLMQNEPNPWNQTTQIGFNLDFSEEVTLNFYTIEGKLIHTIQTAAAAGYNTIQLNKSTLSHEGMIIYELITSQYKLDKRMIKIN